MNIWGDAGQIPARARRSRSRGRLLPAQRAHGSRQKPPAPQCARLRGCLASAASLRCQKKIASARVLEKAASCYAKRRSSSGDSCRSSQLARMCPVALRHGCAAYDQRSDGSCAMMPSDSNMLGNLAARRPTLQGSQQTFRADGCIADAGRSARRLA